MAILWERFSATCLFGSRNMCSEIDLKCHALQNLEITGVRVCMCVFVCVCVCAYMCACVCMLFAANTSFVEAAACFRSPVRQSHILAHRPKFKPAHSPPHAHMHPHTETHPHNHTPTLPRPHIHPTYKHTHPPPHAPTHTYTYTNPPPPPTPSPPPPPTHTHRPTGPLKKRRCRAFSIVAPP